MLTARWAILVHFFAEVLFVVPAYFAYFLVRGLIEGAEAEAVNRADDIIQLERKLGIFWE